MARMVEHADLNHADIIQREIVNSGFESHDARIIISFLIAVYVFSLFNYFNIFTFV